MQELGSSLYQPQRQSIWAVVLILLKYLRVIARQMWPILLIVLIKPTEGRGLMVTLIALGVAFLSFIYAIVSYRRYYYFIQNNELCVRSGVFRKIVLNVPFDRIQSVDFKQNIIHQFFNVVSVQVDTAGSKGSELEIDAISLPHAEELRNTVLAYKKTHAAEVAESEGGIPPIPAMEEPPELIMALSPKDLMKVGISSNHLRTAAIIFAFFVGLADDVEQLLDWDVWGQLDDTTIAASILSFLVILLAVPLLLFVSFFITLIRTVLKYYDLKFWRDGNSYKVVSGLLTRNEKSIQRSKIQIIQWVTSPLKRMFGIFQMNIYQATSVNQGKDKSLVIPGCYMEQVEHTLDTIVPKFRDAVFTAHTMHPAIVILMVCIFGFIPALGFGFLAWYTGSIVQWILVLIFPLAIWMGILYQRKRKLRIHPDYIVSEGGIFGTTNKLIEIYKIQSVTIHSSPMQRRRGVTSLHIYTAGGDIAFPYINAQVAKQARNYILYRAEVEKKSWM